MVTSAAQSLTGTRPTISVVRSLVTGAVAAPAILVLCWIGTFIPFYSPTHAYIGLFTLADPSSGQALLEGAFWSLLFGGLAAGLFAAIYNTAAPFERR